MESKSDEEAQKDSDEEYTAEVKKPSKESNKGNEDKKEGKKAAKKGKGKEAKEGKEQKDANEPKEAKKKKPSKSKEKGGNMEKDTEIVREYMEKQNRPYSLINVFDNLHGSIKKVPLEIILDGLSESENLTCKEFGKNKVYFLNQAKFNIDASEIEKVSERLTKIREENSECQATFKETVDEHKKLLSLPTFQEMETEYICLNSEIENLVKKRARLVGETATKVDEKIVIEAEKEQEKLRKELKKYKNLVKSSIDSWSEALEKKKPEIMEMIGLDI